MVREVEREKRTDKKVSFKISCDGRAGVTQKDEVDFCYIAHQGRGGWILEFSGDCWPGMSQEAEVAYLEA